MSGFLTDFHSISRFPTWFPVINPLMRMRSKVTVVYLCVCLLPFSLLHGSLLSYTALMFSYLSKLDVHKVFDSWILLKPLCYEVMASSSLRGPIPAAILASHTPQLSGLPKNSVANFSWIPLMGVVMLICCSWYIGGYFGSVPTLPIVSCESEISFSQLSWLRSPNAAQCQRKLPALMKDLWEIQWIFCPKRTWILCFSVYLHPKEDETPLHSRWPIHEQSCIIKVTLNLKRSLYLMNR